MATALSQAKRLHSAWSRKPGAALALTLRRFYGKNARKLPLKTRAELCLALGEAAELEGRFEHARWLYASAVGASDPHADERLYARAVLRSLLNASRLGDGTVLSGVAALLERAPGARRPRAWSSSDRSRAAWSGSCSRTTSSARRGFEAAMGASWESHDADGEALAHHLLAQTWNRLGKLARAREHAEAARSAAKNAGSGS